MKYFHLLILFIISCTPTEPEIKEELFVSECGGPYGYDCGDYILLEEFIELNAQIFRHYLDVNENGIVEAMEFGYQVWDYPGSGRLIWLDLNYPKDIIMKQPISRRSFLTTTAATGAAVTMPGILTAKKDSKL